MQRSAKFLGEVRQSKSGRRHPLKPASQMLITIYSVNTLHSFVTLKKKMSSVYRFQPGKGVDQAE
jgi:hypothetical protein